MQVEPREERSPERANPCHQLPRHLYSRGGPQSTPAAPTHRSVLFLRLPYARKCSLEGAVHGPSQPGTRAPPTLQPPRRKLRSDHVLCPGFPSTSHASCPPHLSLWPCCLLLLPFHHSGAPSLSAISPTLMASSCSPSSPFPSGPR